MLRRDATVTYDVMRKLMNDETKDVVLIMHSYGGISGSEAVAMVKQWLDVYGQPDHGRVRRLVYLAAHVVGKGEALMGGGRTLNVANFDITEV
jgi:pimeloyl-ACP methyl ester carboxylesterase